MQSKAGAFISSNVIMWGNKESWRYGNPINNSIHQLN